jgi:hypothetical protein
MARNWAAALTVSILILLTSACGGGSQFSENQKRFEKEAKIYCADIEASKTWDEWQAARYPLRLAQSTLGLLPTEVTEVLNKVCPKGGEVGENLARAACASDPFPGLSDACRSLED